MKKHLILVSVIMLSLLTVRCINWFADNLDKKVPQENRQEKTYEELEREIENEIAIHRDKNVIVIPSQWS